MTIIMIMMMMMMMIIIIIIIIIKDFGLYSRYSVFALDCQTF